MGIFFFLNSLAIWNFANGQKMLPRSVASRPLAMGRQQ